MANRSHLVPTPVTDRNGKQTTVFKKPQGASGSSLAGMPAPTVAAPAKAPSRDEDYAARLASVEADNAAYRADKDLQMALVRAAGEGMTTITLAAARGFRGDAEGLASSLGSAFEDEAYSRVAIADLFGSLYAALLDTEDEDIDLSDVEQLWTWQDETSADAGAYYGTMVVAATLQKLKLSPLAEVPPAMSTVYEQPEGERDIRFVSHLYAHVRGAIDYRETEDEADLIRLIDEYPEQVREITMAAEDGLHAAAIRAQLLGTVESALVDGAL